MKFIAVMALMSISFSAFSLTLAERKKAAEWDAELKGPDGYAATFKEKCGYDLPVKLEEKFVTPFMEANTSATSYCESTRSTMAQMCGADKLNKEAITAKVKKVDCRLGAKGQKDLKLEKDGTLVFTVGLEASNLDDAVRAFLDKSL